MLVIINTHNLYFTCLWDRVPVGSTSLPATNKRHRAVYVIVLSRKDIFHFSKELLINAKKEILFTYSCDVERLTNFTELKKEQDGINQCFSTAGLRSGTGHGHQLYRARERFYCHFSFLSKFSWINVLQWGYSEEKKIFANVLKKLRPRCLAWGNYSMLQDFVGPVIDN